LKGWANSLTGAAERAPLLRPPRFERVLVVAPHPDDEAVGCGGYLLRLAEQGGEITVLFMTDGERGVGCQALAAAAATRRDEAHGAARLLHVRRLVHWSLPDGDLSVESGAAARLSRLVRQLAAQVVLVPHEREAHPDHAAVAQLAAHLDVRPDVTVMTYEVWTPQEPGCVVDVTAQMSRKLEAVRTYRSQCQRFNLETLVTGLGQYRAAWSRMRAWRFAEAFGIYGLAEYKGRNRANRR
jgi:LmbE family N-acetylglucosaminyl deacetylase